MDLLKFSRKAPCATGVPLTRTELETHLNEAIAPFQLRAYAEFRCRVAGVSYYQSALNGLKSEERLVLTHEPDNPVDTMAVKVSRLTGEQIGYLGRGTRQMDLGVISKGRYFASVSVVGRPNPGAPVGAGVQVVYWYPDHIVLPFKLAHGKGPTLARIKEKERLDFFVDGDMVGIRRFGSKGAFGRLPPLANLLAQVVAGNVRGIIENRETTSVELWLMD